MHIQSSSFSMRLLGIASLAVFSLQSAPNLFAASTGEPGSDKQGPNPLRNVYFGEQHLHTANSPDAFVIGVRGTWEDAYNWAMGKEIILSTTGQTIKKSTPYDFVGIPDHAEYFGVLPSFINPQDPLYQTELAKKIRDPNADPSAPDSAINQILASIITSTPMQELVTPELLSSNWKRYVETANKFQLFSQDDAGHVSKDNLDLIKDLAPPARPTICVVKDEGIC